MRQWNYDTSECVAIMKYADPITVCKFSSSMNILFTGAWDKMVRCYDMEQNKIVKSFVAAKD